jgi:hypothetical protein
MVAWASSKILVHFNGCVCFKKNIRYHILGTISSLGIGKGRIMEKEHVSKHRYARKKWSSQLFPSFEMKNPLLNQ